MVKLRTAAQAYLEYLYSDEGQDLAGKHVYRPISPKAQAKYAKQFPRINFSPPIRPLVAGPRWKKEHSPMARCLIGLKRQDNCNVRGATNTRQDPMRAHLSPSQLHAHDLAGSLRYVSRP